MSNPNSRHRASTRGIAVAVLALALAPALSAQKASYTYIDQPPPYANWNPPGLVAVNTPKLGTTFQFQVLPSWYGDVYWGPWHSNHLFTGLSNPNFDLRRLQLGLGYSQSGFLFSSGELVHFIPRGSPNKYITLSLPIPNVASLAGFSFWQQVVSFSGANCGFCRVSISASRGGHAVVGT